MIEVPQSYRETCIPQSLGIFDLSICKECAFSDYSAPWGREAWNPWLQSEGSGMKAPEWQSCLGSQLRRPGLLVPCLSDCSEIWGERSLVTQSWCKDSLRRSRFYLESFFDWCQSIQIWESGRIFHYFTRSENYLEKYSKSLSKSSEKLPIWQSQILDSAIDDIWYPYCQPQVKED